MKNILFLHQNFPGQFRHLAPHLSRQGWQVVGLGETGNIKRQTRLPNTQTLGYPHTPRQAHGHAYLRTVEHHVRQGQSALRGLLILKRTFTPDIICAHPGWGEALFLREVFPNSKIINYCEFFYRADGADVGFDPDSPPQRSMPCAACACAIPRTCWPLTPATRAGHPANGRQGNSRPPTGTKLKSSMKA